MIIIRLKRRSSKNRLSYAIVVTSNRTTPAGSQFIEKIGYYKPLVDTWSNKYLFIDFDRLKF
jgi:ribosomal protein S16